MSQSNTKSMDKPTKDGYFYDSIISGSSLQNDQNLPGIIAFYYRVLSKYLKQNVFSTTNDCDSAY